MKKTMYFILSITLISLLCSCSDDASLNSLPPDSEASKETASINENTEKASSENPENKLQNTEKLIFDEAIINTPDITEICSLTFERRDWTKTELTEAFIACSNYFADEGYNHRAAQITENDLSYSYIDEIGGEREEQIGRNFYRVSVDNDEISSTYNHYSCFFSAISNKLDDTGGAMTYFSDSTETSITKMAESLLTSTTAAYSDFFSISEFELFPFSYEISASIKHFKYGVAYKGIALDTNYYASMDSDVLDVHMGSNFAELTANNEDTLLSMISYYNWKVSENETYTELLPFEEACNIVSENISDNVTFEVSRVDLLYKIDEVLDENGHVLNWSGEPCWKFTIDSTGIGEYQRIAFFVDLITGEFTTYEIVM